MKRKVCNFVLIILLMGSMLFVLTGCGSDNDNEKSDDNEEKTEGTKNVEKVAGQYGSFVEYKGYIYYWKVDEGSRERNGVYAGNDDVLDYENDLVKIDENGKEEIVISDKGSGDIFIVNDKIFLSYTADEYGNERSIYSVDLNGDNKIEYCNGLMKYIVGDYIYGQTKNNGDIFVINTETDDVNTIKKQANIIGCEDGVIYYTEEFDYTKKNLSIGSIDGEEDNGVIYTFDSSNFESYTRPVTISASTIWKENNKLNTYIGYSDGSANLLQELVQLEMDENGENDKITEIETYYGSYDEEINSKGKVYFKIMNYTDYYRSLVYIDKETGEMRELMTEKEINEKYDFLDDDEHQISLYIGGAIDNDIYVMIDYCEHYPEGDVGWRYAYKRLKTVCFKYNLKDHKFTDIYDFGDKV